MSNSLFFLIYCEVIIIKYLVKNKILNKYYSKTIINKSGFEIIWGDLKDAKAVSLKTANSIINGKLIYNKDNNELEIIQITKEEEK